MLDTSIKGTRESVKKSPFFPTAFTIQLNSPNFKMADIYFNSKSDHKWRKLSNFYGGAEFEYQSEVAVGGVDELFADFQKCDSTRFLNVLQQIQPKKKTWTPKKKEWWFTKDGQPIRGILAKIVAGARTNTKRMRVIKELAPNFSIRPEATVQEKKDAMLRALRKKFRHPQYRDLLLSSGSRVIHEMPMRGNGSNSLWTYKIGQDGKAYGGNLLGQLLMQVRQELRQKMAEPTPILNATPSQNRHKRRRVPEADGDDDVIDLTGDTPANKRVAKESTKESTLANDDDERKALATVMGIIQRVRGDANNRLDTDNIGDTSVPEELVGVARALNSLYTDFAGHYLSRAVGDRWPEVGAQETLACMDDRDDSRSFGQLLRAVREDP